MALTIVYSRGEPREVRLILTGPLAGEAVEEFAQQLAEAALAAARVVVDLERVGAIDRAGARCLSRLDPERVALVGARESLARAIRRENLT
ncbi:MAG: hypothetical protein ABFD84_13975 [Candidatus Polarisedimenticolia bacterium]